MEAKRPQVEFRVLGAVEAVLDGRRLSLGGPRQQALLALLLLEPGRPVSIDRLTAELWADDPPEGADVTLRSYMSRLRAALGGSIRIRANPAGYAIEVDPDTVDAHRFERAVLAEAGAPGGTRNPRRSRDRLATALDLWSGRPFAQLSGEGALRVEAERLEELRLQALERRIDADLDLDRAEPLVPELEALLREHPFRERFWLQLMLALYRSDRQADALAAYHRARTTLDEQLGIEPGEALVALESAILRHDVPRIAVPERLDTLPAPVTSFVGRATALRQVEALVGAHRLVTLTGVGGVGKTRLAVEAARTIAPSFADGVAFVDLAPLADPTLVVEQIAAVFAEQRQSTLNPLDALVAHLRERELLLVLDNCEHLLAAAADAAARLLASCPSLRVIATSREVLGIDGEADLAVPPLGLPDADDPAARDAESVALFVARARTARPDLAEDDATIAAVARICAVLEGIPLAIELAAARARVLSPSEIGDRLHDRFRFLVSWRRLTTARHRTLREAMDWSYDLLDEDGQRLLAELSVFAGGFTLDAVDDVCTVDSPGSALDHVQRLVEASLVTVERDGAQTRYGLLETVREYGGERLEAAGRTEPVHRRHAEHFAAVADHGWLEVRVPSTEHVQLARLRADRDNLRAALSWSLDHGESRLALLITGTLWRYWWLRGEAVEGRAWLERVLDADDGSEPALRARSLVGLAGLIWSLGDIAAAEAPAKEALALGMQIGDDIVIANASNVLGLISSDSGRMAQARTYFAESVARNRIAEMPEELRQWNLAIAIDNLGSIAHYLGDRDDALRHWTEARAINERIGSRVGVAMNDLHLTLLESEEGRHDEARRRLVGALSFYSEIGFLHYAAEGIHTAAMIANGMHQPAEAAYLLGAATRIHRQLDNQPWAGMARLREREGAAARSALGDAAFEAAYATGVDAPVSDAVLHAIEFLGG